MNNNKKIELDYVLKQREKWNESSASGNKQEEYRVMGSGMLNYKKEKVLFDEYNMLDEPFIPFEETIVERAIPVKDNNVENNSVLDMFGSFDNVKPEQCNTVFNEVLAYENIEMLGDNFFDFHPEKDFKMTCSMIGLTAYADSYNYDNIVKDFRKYGQVDSKDLAGNTIFDILAIKFRFQEYSNAYSNLKEKSQSSVSRGLFSVAKGLLDEVTKGGFSAIADDFTKDFMERNYKNSRKKILDGYKETIRKYDFTPIQIGEIVKGKVNELIVKDTVKDEFETTVEYNIRLKDSINKKFSEVFCKYKEMIYEIVKQRILEYNKRKTLMMLYSSYFFNINKEKLLLGAYNADNEYFKVTDGWNDYTLLVPRSVAKSFKENFSNIKGNCYVISNIKGDKINLRWLVSYSFNNKKYITKPSNREINI